MNGRRSRVILLLSLATILTIAIFFRFYYIGQIPPGLFPDEATHALDAQNVLKGQLSLYSPNEGSTGMVWRYLLAINFALFGSSILTLRAFASAVGVVSVVMAYLLVRELPLTEQNQATGQGRREAIAGLAALLLAISYWHVDLSRIAFSAVLMLLIQDIALFCLWRALNTGQRRWFVLFGLGLGVLAYNYLPGKLAPLVPLLFLLLEWPIAQRDALLVKYGRPLLIGAGLALVIALPLILFAVFNYQMLVARAALPSGAAEAPLSPWRAIGANLAAFGLWPAYWLPGNWGRLFLGPILTLCFVVGVGVSLVRIRRPAYLFLLVWWLVMLLPGALAPEGAIPNVRRSIGAATPTFGLIALGLVSAAGGLARLAGRLSRSMDGSRIQPALALALGLILAVPVGASTFTRYFVQWGPSEEAKLEFHVYDLELADLMARQSGAETVYLLPLDSAAGSINPLLDSIAFVYRGQASYDFLSDDEQAILARLSKLTAGKTVARLVHWKVTKHTGADPKGVVQYYLEKWGRWVDTRSYPYFDIETYQLDNVSDAFTPVPLTRLDVGFEGQMALTGYAYGPRSTATAGDFLWTELTWRKTGDTPADYQVALWLEDRAGHVIGRVDKPLLNNLKHQGTVQWAVGEEERDYYLVPIDATTLPGAYRLKAVLYIKDGQRLPPLLSGVGADLAVALGSATMRPPLAPPDAVTLSIPKRLDLDVGGGLHLLGFDPGFSGPLRPGKQAALSLWWQATQPLSQNLAVALGIGHDEQVWPLNKPQPLGGSDYPSRDWPAGTVVRTFVDLRVPADVEAGKLNLGLRLVNVENGVSLSNWLLGQVDVAVRTRSFEAPHMTHLLGTNFGNQATLLGYDLDLTNFQVDSPVQLTLYWQAQKGMDTAYRVFVHLLEPTGGIVVQMDREPRAGDAPTTGWLAGEVVKDDIVMKVSGAATTAHAIAIGLYDPATGARVPVLDAAGAVIGDSVTFPIE
jgi:hypothetical protein